jgi:hypothetical protein
VSEWVRGRGERREGDHGVRLNYKMQASGVEACASA